jgi:hypothetical protein
LKAAFEGRLTSTSLSGRPIQPIQPRSLSEAKMSETEMSYTDWNNLKEGELLEGWKWVRMNIPV